MCPCLPVESLLLHIDFLRIDCVHDLQNQLLTIIIIIPITNHANTHHRNGFCVMPLWDSMKCVKSQNQLLFHTMIKLTDSFMCVLHWKSKNNVFVHVHVLSFIYRLRISQVKLESIRFCCQFNTICLYDSCWIIKGNVKSNWLTSVVCLLHLPLEVWLISIVC